MHHIIQLRAIFVSFSSRPPLHHLVVPEQIERVVILAWNKTPQDRPSFSQIVDSLKEVAGAEGEVSDTISWMASRSLSRCSGLLIPISR